MENKDFIQKLRQAVDVAVEARFKNERRTLMSSVGQDVAKLLEPTIKELASSAKLSKDDLREAAQELAASVNARELSGVDTGAIIEAIYVAFGNLHMPQPRVNVTSPKVDVPALQWPEGEMPIKGWVNLMGVSMENPLPVQLRDSKGNPLKLFDNLTQIIQGGASGGKHDFYTIKGFTQSAYSELMNADGRLRVSVETGGSGLTDAELRAAHLDVLQLSGSIDSVYITGASGSIAAALVDSGGIQYSGSNPLPVTITSGATATSAVNVVDSTGVIFNGDNPMSVKGTVAVSGITNSVGATILNGEGLARDSWLVSDITASVKAALVDSSGVQYSGSNPLTIGGTVLVSDITASVKSSLIDSSGVGYSGSNPVPVVIASGAGASQAAALIDSSGIQYSGSNPVPVSGAVTVSGSVSSTVVTGPVVSDAADDGSAPVKVGGIARQANPTAVAAGDSVSASMDDLGRTLTRPIQVRDLTQTAYATFSNGTEGTLIAGVASTFLDLIYIMGANNSDAAVSVDIRSGTGGSVIMTLQIPASGTAGVSLPVPLPQEVVAGAWTVDLPDITGTTVSVSALFSKEV